MRSQAIPGSGLVIHRLLTQFTQCECCCTSSSIMASPARPARPQRRSVPGRPGRRARRLRTVTAPNRARSPGRATPLRLRPGAAGPEAGLGASPVRPQEEARQPPPSRAHTRSGLSGLRRQRPASHLSLPARPLERLRDFPDWLLGLAPTPLLFSRLTDSRVSRRSGKTLGNSCKSKLLMERAETAECGDFGWRTRARLLSHRKGS